MPGRASKDKGSKYERELAAYINEATGLESRRALLSGGGRNEGGCDVEGVPMIHVEAKRVESFRPYEAIFQAEKAVGQAREKTMPTVFTRRNNMKTGESLVVMRLDAWLDMYRVYLAATADRTAERSLHDSSSRSVSAKSSSSESSLPFMS